jgi:hypothetical protein
MVESTRVHDNETCTSTVPALMQFDYTTIRLGDRLYMSHMRRTLIFLVVVGKDST